MSGIFERMLSAYDTSTMTKCKTLADNFEMNVGKDQVESLIQMKIDIKIGDSSVAAGVVSDLSMADGIIIPVQTHSCNVGLIGRDGVAPQLDDTDAVVCLSEGLRIGVRTADCVPILLYDPEARCVAAVHAGWRGSIGGIVTATVRTMCDIGCAPERMYAAFGPCICGDCYEVSEELAEDFRREGFGSCIRKGRNIDLEQVNRERLMAAGVQREHITPSPCCTLQTPELPSWRRGATDRRLVTWIALSPSSTGNENSIVETSID